MKANNKSNACKSPNRKPQQKKEIIMSQNYKTLCKLPEVFSRSPILSQVRVKDKFAMATDMDTWITQPCDIEDGLYFYQAFEKNIFIKSSMVFEDFPDSFIMGEKQAEVYIDKNEMAAFNWVKSAASNEESRYYLNGVCFSGLGQCVATDGARLHMFDVRRNDLNLKRDYIIPNKACRLISKLFEDYDCQTTRIIFHEKGFVAVIGEATIKGKLIDGTFPNYTRIQNEFDKADYKETSFDVDALIVHMPEIKIITKIEGIREMHLMLGEETALLKSNGTIPGDRFYDIKFPCPVPIKCNARYLSELCGGRAFYSNPLEPVKFVNDKYSPTRTAYLMPVR